MNIHFIVRISPKKLYVHGYCCTFTLTISIHKPDDGPMGPKHVVKGKGKGHPATGRGGTRGSE